jgi:hypothetical protein
MTIQIAPLKRRTGHYVYQDGKTVFDSRPKRKRTRANRDWDVIREQIDA